MDPHADSPIGRLLAYLRGQQTVWLVVAPSDYDRAKWMLSEGGYDWVQINKSEFVRPGHATLVLANKTEHVKLNDLITSNILPNT